MAQVWSVLGSVCFGSRRWSRIKNSTSTNLKLLFILLKSEGDVISGWRTVTHSNHSDDLWILIGQEVMINLCLSWLFFPSVTVNRLTGKLHPTPSPIGWLTKDFHSVSDLWVLSTYQWPEPWGFLFLCGDPAARSTQVIFNRFKSLSLTTDPEISVVKKLGIKSVFIFHLSV